MALGYQIVLSIAAAVLLGTGVFLAFRGEFAPAAGYWALGAIVVAGVAAWVWRGRRRSGG